MFSTALNATITMCLKLKEKYGISFNLEDLIDVDSFVIFSCHCLHLTLGKTYVGF
jgi:hypothetical protein